MDARALFDEARLRRDGEVDVEARARGDDEIRLDRVAGRCRRVHAEYGEQSYWFAFRRPLDWVKLDLARQNGTMHLGTSEGRQDVLVVDGRAAVHTKGDVSPNCRAWAMVADGFPVWTTDPDRVERGQIDGRRAETLFWDHPSVTVSATYDLSTGLCVATVDSTVTVTLSELWVDSDVPDKWFDAPPALDDWRGGTAYAQEDTDAPGTYSASWTPASGPSETQVWGPDAVPLDDALVWTRSRATTVMLDDAQGHRRPV